MGNRSKKINLYDKEKIKLVNPETLGFMKKYKVDMMLRGLSENTIYQYETDLNQWFVYIYDNQANQSVADINEDDITEFLYFCKTEGNNSDRMKRRMSSISAFYKFLRKKKLVGENPMEFIDRPKKGVPIIVQTFLTQEQVDELKIKLENYGDLQLQTYILFGLSTMARVNAISHLRWEQIDFDERICSNVLEKENKIVDLFFSEEVKQLLLALNQYRKDNNINDFGWVFFSGHQDRNTPINNGTLNGWCKKAGEFIGVPTLHNHDLRHTSSNLLKERGMNLEDIATLLHHESTETTVKHYLTVNKKKIKEIKDAMDI